MRWRNLWFAFVLILALIIPARADGPGPHRVYLPIISTGCDMTSTTLAEFSITDGTTTISLLRGNVHLSDWKPAVAQLKSGGIWQDSPMSTGRRMVDRRFGNVSDTLSLVVSSHEQDETIRHIGDLLRLLEKARDFTASSWQTEPVWIVRQAGCETSPTHALLFDYKIPQLSNPYAAPFAAATQLATMNNFTLSLEHSIWLGDTPGTGTCVQTSGVQSWAATGVWQVIDDFTPAGNISSFLEAQDGTIYAGVEAPQILESNDGGLTWGVNAAHTVYALLQTANGYIFAGATSAIWLSTDNGASWVDVADAGMVGTVSGLTETPTGRVIAAAGGGGIWVSDNYGTTWTQTYVATGANVINGVIAADNGNVLATDSVPPGLFLSTDNGATWHTPQVIGASITDPTKSPNGAIYVIDSSIGQESIWKSTDNGVSWSRMAGFAAMPVATYAVSDSVIYVGGTNGEVWRSNDAGITWELETTLSNAPFAFLYTSGGLLLAGLAAGAASSIWGNDTLSGGAGELIDVGQAVTCSDSVFIANKANVANLSHIYIDDGGVFSANLFPFTFPGTTSLLPAAPAIGDAVYFGIDTTLVDSGPFESLVFDLYDIISYTNSYTITWGYSDGAAGWPPLTVTDGTNGAAVGAFTQPGVQSVHWEPPTDWVEEALNGVTAFWVQARVSALVGAMTPPSQQNRDIYTITWPHAAIAAAQVPGDIPALAQVKLHNRSDQDGGSNPPSLYDNRIVIGLRSLDRGPTFTAYLNASDEQNPVGVTVADGANTAIGADVTGITGRVATYTGPGGGVWTDEITFTLGPTIARDFYGTFHAFLRATLDPNGTSGNIHARLQVRTGSGGVTLTSAEDYLKDTDPFEVLDFGRVSIPASGLLSYDDLGDSTALVVQLRDDSAGGLDNLIHDLILIPVDEWATDAVDYANIATSVIGRQSSTPHLLDVDSLTYQKVDQRAIVRTADGNGFVTSIYVPSGGPAILQCNADQRLWVFAMQTSATGTAYVWLAPPWIAHSIQVFSNSRWLGLRGDR